MLRPGAPPPRQAPSSQHAARVTAHGAPPAAAQVPKLGGGAGALDREGLKAALLSMLDDNAFLDALHAKVRAACGPALAMGADELCLGQGRPSPP